VRHTFASLLAQKGISIYKVAGWLGDGLEVTVDHYAHLAPQDRDLQRSM
jgi:site-specific recombinase XerD